MNTHTAGAAKSRLFSVPLNSGLFLWKKTTSGKRPLRPSKKFHGYLSGVRTGFTARLKIDPNGAYPARGHGDHPLRGRLRRDDVRLLRGELRLADPSVALVGVGAGPQGVSSLARERLRQPDKAVELSGGGSDRPGRTAGFGSGIYFKYDPAEDLPG